MSEIRKIRKREDNETIYKELLETHEAQPQNQYKYLTVIHFLSNNLDYKFQMFSEAPSGTVFVGTFFRGQCKARSRSTRGGLKTEDGCVGKSFQNFN